MTIGAVAAHNLAAILNLDVSHVGTIEQAIKDEIGAMSTHFTLAMADVQTQYEAETLKLKRDYEIAVSTFSYVKANTGKIVGVLSAVATVAGFVGHFV